jgi:hypothetical protein
MSSNFSNKSMGSRASIVSGRGTQTGEWVVGPRAVNKAKGGMWWYGWWHWVLCGVWVVYEWCYVVGRWCYVVCGWWPWVLCGVWVVLCGGCVVLCGVWVVLYGG